MPILMMLMSWSRYAETYGAQAMNTSLEGGGGGAVGVFRCIDGDFCQREYYDYGPINATEYPHFPVMNDARWCLENKYKTSTAAVQHALHAQLKETYCSQRRLEVDRMGCTAK
eukprot:COSAG01_NODE_12878_length_1671_cov_1.831425_1_plen_113_part_00